MMRHDRTNTNASPVLHHASPGWKFASGFLKDFTFHERHACRADGVSAKKIMDGVAGFDLESDPVIRGLLLLRRLPSKLRGRSPKAITFGDFCLLERGDRYVLYGLAGKFWRPGMALAKLNTLDDFLSYRAAGAAKLVLYFGVEVSDDIQHLVTDTFIQCNDTQALVAMSVYWPLVRPFSGWIRRRTLRRILASI